MVSPNPGLMAALLKSGHLSGVVRWKVDLSNQIVATEISASGFAGYFLETSGAITLEQTFELFSNQLKFGKLSLTNFESQLKTLVPTQAGIFIAWSGWQDFVKTNPEDAAGVIDIFESACESWPGVVLVVDKVGKFQNLNELAAG